MRTCAAPVTRSKARRTFRYAGYRIPRGAFGENDLWALDVLAEEGFAYDSSIRPFGFEFAKQPFRRFVHRHEHAGRSIWEVPLSTWKLGPLTLPISGGNYLRQLPHAFIRHAIGQWVREQSSPLVFYFHIWELDPEQPRISAVSRLEARPTVPQSARDGGTNPALSAAIPVRHDRAASTAAGGDARPGPRPAGGSARGGEAGDGRIGSGASSDGDQCRRALLQRGSNSGLSREHAGQLRAERPAQPYQVSFIFVDDGSSDGTWERLNELFGRRAEPQVVQHPRNRGIAAATLTGIRHSRSEIVCAIDADGTFDPHQLKEMIPMLRPDVDAVTASCFAEHGQVMNVPGWRIGPLEGGLRAVPHGAAQQVVTLHELFPGLSEECRRPACPSQRALRRYHRCLSSLDIPGIENRRISRRARGAAIGQLENEDHEDDLGSPAADRPPRRRKAVRRFVIAAGPPRRTAAPLGVSRSTARPNLEFGRALA